MPTRARYHSVRIAEVVQETPDAVSLTLEVPPAESDLFAYRAGQFVGVRVVLDGEAHLRSYSMSSPPDVDNELRVTVKRLADEEWGQRVHAVIEPVDPGEPPSYDDVRDYVKTRLSPYKVPKSLEGVDAIPRSEAMKVNRGRMIAERLPAPT